MDENGIKIEIDPEVAEGIYSNLVFVGHSSSEFVIDFVRVMPNTAISKVKSRIVMAPEHAKRLMFLLQQGIVAYEKKFGMINLEEERQSVNISSIKGEA